MFGERCGSRGGVSSYFMSRYVAVRRAACLSATRAALPLLCDALLWTAMGFSGGARSPQLRALRAIPTCHENGHFASVGAPERKYCFGASVIT